MKKILVLAFFSLISVLMMGCNGTEKITITVPFGAPEFAQIYLKNSDKYDSKTVNGADGLVAAFGSKSSDVIFAPTNLGAKIYNEGSVEYILLASIVWGNLYFVSQSEITGINDLDNKDVVLYGNNQIPGFVSEFIIDEYDITANVSYLASTADTAAALTLESNKDKIYLVSKPQVSQIENKSNLSIYKLDVQELYKDKTGSESFPQASVFIKSSLSDSIKETVLLDLENSIKKLSEELDTAAQYAINLGIGSLTTDLETMKNAIVGSNISFKKAMDAKPFVEDFFNLLLTKNPKLIGSKLPTGDFYYNI